MKRGFFFWGGGGNNKRKNKKVLLNGFSLSLYFDISLVSSGLSLELGSLLGLVVGVLLKVSLLLFLFGSGEEKRE